MEESENVPFVTNPRNRAIWWDHSKLNEPGPLPWTAEEWIRLEKGQSIV